jgi:hypothetical protein
MFFYIIVKFWHVANPIRNETIMDDVSCQFKIEFILFFGLISFILLIMQYNFQIYFISLSHQNTSFSIYFKLNCLFNIYMQTLVDLFFLSYLYKCNLNYVKTLGSSSIRTTLTTLTGVQHIEINTDCPCKDL